MRDDQAAALRWCQTKLSTFSQENAFRDLVSSPQQKSRTAVESVERFNSVGLRSSAFLHGSLLTFGKFAY
jgi:hypothetical protein